MSGPQSGNPGNASPPAQYWRSPGIPQPAVSNPHNFGPSYPFGYNYKGPSYPFGSSYYSARPAPSPGYVVPPSYRGQRWVPGYWWQQWVPQYYVYQVFVPGYFVDGAWVEGYYDTRTADGGYYQQVWVDGYWIE